MRIEHTVVNIIFDAGKGSVAQASREGTVGEPLGTLPIPTRNGYRFVGWYLGDVPVSAQTPVEEDRDLRLTARWERVSVKERKKTVMWKQKVFAGVLAVAIVFLTAGILIANHVVAIYHISDEYVDENGTAHTDRYTVKKDDGEYKLFNRDGKLMEVIEDAYTASTNKVYVAEKSGNQYLINTSTGEHEVYAVVDYDAASGEMIGGTKVNPRVMMFPRIGQDNTYSITVTNQYGTYTFYRENVENTDASAGKKYTTVVGIKKGSGEDATDVLASYDATLFASLCVSCGYSLTTMRLNFQDPETPRLADGSVDMNAYGLVDRYDEDGNLTYSPAVYTIVQGKTDDSTGKMEADKSYTVKVGDAILSGGGYYVQLEGRDTVYIVSSTIADTVLQPVESLVTPGLIYPMTVSTYVMVNDFFFGTVADMSKIDSKDEEESKKNINIKVLFDYVDLARRQDSLYSSSPYWISEKLGASMGDGFVLDSDSVSTVLGNLYQMEFVGCKVINPTDEDLKAYGLDRNTYLIRFKYDPDIASGGSDEEQWADNWLFISQKTEDGTYYAYSALYNMIVEVDQSYFSFLEWSDSHWYNKYYFQQNIAYLKSMTIKFGSTAYQFVADNTLSYAYYDKDQDLGLASGTVISPYYLTQLSGSYYRYTDPSSGKKYTVAYSNLSKEYDENGKETGNYIYTKIGTAVDLKSGTLSADGQTFTLTKTGKRYTVHYADLTKTTVKSYYTSNGTKTSSVVYIDENGTEFTISATTTNLKIYCNGSLVDYTVSETVSTDTGSTETNTYTALDNFRRLYTKLLWSSIEGDVSEKELGSSIVDYVKNHDATLEITVNVEDMAAILNREYHDKNNTVNFVIRLYSYTEGKALLTIETLTDENQTPDPTRITKGFYVLNSEVEEIMQYATDYVNGKLLPKPN